MWMTMVLFIILTIKKILNNKGGWACVFFYLHHVVSLHHQLVQHKEISKANGHIKKNSNNSMPTQNCDLQNAVWILTSDCVCMCVCEWVSASMGVLLVSLCDGYNIGTKSGCLQGFQDWWVSAMYNNNPPASTEWMKWNLTFSLDSDLFFSHCEY